MSRRRKNPVYNGLIPHECFTKKAIPIDLRYEGQKIVGALNGEDKEALLSDHYCPIPGYWDANPLIPEIAAIASGSFKRKNPPEIQGSGFVVKSLEAALWAFYNSATFAEGCLLAVNLGDDADTTGAIYGQFAGAYYGQEQINNKWIAMLHGKDILQKYAEGLQHSPENWAGQ